MRTLVTLFLLITLNGAYAQSAKRVVRFIPSFNEEPLLLGQQQLLANKTPVTVTQFRFYVSHLALYSKGKQVAADTSCHLIDASKPVSLEIAIVTASSATTDSITFLLGVDSVTNAGGVKGGDLDPIKGMYWTWNSGYVNLKLEGTCEKCPAKEGEFQYHLGGFLPPNASAQWIGLPAPAKGPVAIDVDLADLLDRLDLSKLSAIMSPGEKAVHASRIAATVFTTADAY